jgi:hypothetical protein
MRKLFKLVLLLCLVSVLSACSYTAVETPNATTNFSPQPGTLEIGPVSRTNAPFYNGFEEGFDTLPGIKVIRYFSGDEHEPISLVLKGNLKINARDGFGEKVSRHLFGFGISRREVNGLFEIEDLNHDTVMSFAVNEYYNGGTGLGGLLDVPGLIISPFIEGLPYLTQTDIISTDTMQRRLGIEVGEQVRGWLLARTPQ